MAMMSKWINELPEPDDLEAAVAFFERQFRKGSWSPDMAEVLFRLQADPTPLRIRIGSFIEKNSRP